MPVCWLAGSPRPATVPDIAGRGTALAHGDRDWRATTAGECNPRATFRELLALLPRCRIVQCSDGSRLVGCHGITVERGLAMDAIKANFSASGTPWERADLFFLVDALARGMSIQGLGRLPEPVSG
jgi:hypothetical protein